MFSPCFYLPIFNLKSLNKQLFFLRLDADDDIHICASKATLCISCRAPETCENHQATKSPLSENLTSM